MDDVHGYQCTFFDSAGKVIGFDAHKFSDDGAAREWARRLKVPPAATSRELRDDYHLVETTTVRLGHGARRRFSCGQVPPLIWRPRLQLEHKTRKPRG